MPKPPSQVWLVYRHSKSAVYPWFWMAEGDRFEFDRNKPEVHCKQLIHNAKKQYGYEFFFEKHVDGRQWCVKGKKLLPPLTLRNPELPL